MTKRRLLTRAAGVDRRRVLAASAAAAGGLVLAMPSARAQDYTQELRAAVAVFAQGAAVQVGRVLIDIAELVDNGNAVPLGVTVQSPMTVSDHVVAIAVFNEKNPQRDVAMFRLGPRSGRAQVNTRVRLATSQKLVAVARMQDGSCWSGSVDVIVTIAACIEGEA